MSLEEMIEVNKKLVDRGLVVGGGGNSSYREENSIYVTPSGYPLQKVGKDDYVEMDLETGEILSTGGQTPTSEWHTHFTIYRERPEVKAIVHTHPPYTIALISSGVEMKPITPEHAVFMENSVTIPYIIPCGEELADAIRKKISDFDIILLRNHGVITLGESVLEAFTRAELIEDAAKVQFLSQQIGEPKFLSRAEISEVQNLDAETYRKKLLREQNL